MKRLALTFAILSLSQSFVACSGGGGGFSAAPQPPVASDTPVIKNANFSLGEADSNDIPADKTLITVNSIRDQAVDYVNIANVGIAITQNTGAGTWEYRTTGVGPFSSMGSYTVSNALLLPPGAEVRYIPTEEEVFTGNLQVYGWTGICETAGITIDLSDLGAYPENCFTPSAANASLDIRSINDVPQINAAISVELVMDEDHVQQNPNLADPPTYLTPVGPGGGDPVTDVADLESVPGGLDNIIDPDKNAVTGIAVVGTNESNGKWWYTTNNVATPWQEMGSVSNANALLLSSDTDTRILFIPNPDWAGTIPDAITFKAWDQTFGSNGDRVPVVAGASNVYKRTIKVEDIQSALSETRGLVIKKENYNDKVKNSPELNKYWNLMAGSWSDKKWSNVLPYIPFMKPFTSDRFSIFIDKEDKTLSFESFSNVKGDIFAEPCHFKVTLPAKIELIEKAKDQFGDVIQEKKTNKDGMIITESFKLSLEKPKDISKAIAVVPDRSNKHLVCQEFIQEIQEEYRKIAKAKQEPCDPKAYVCPWTRKFQNAPYRYHVDYLPKTKDTRATLEIKYDNSDFIGDLNSDKHRRQVENAHFARIFGRQSLTRNFDSSECQFNHASGIYASSTQVKSDISYYINFDFCQLQFHIAKTSLVTHSVEPSFQANYPTEELQFTKWISEIAKPHLPDMDFAELTAYARMDETSASITLSEAEGTTPIYQAKISKDKGTQLKFEFIDLENDKVLFTEPLLAQITSRPIDVDFCTEKTQSSLSNYIVSGFYANNKQVENKQLYFLKIDFCLMTFREIHTFETVRQKRDRNIEKDIYKMAFNAVPQANDRYKRWIKETLDLPELDLSSHDVEVKVNAAGVRLYLFSVPEKNYVLKIEPQVGGNLKVSLVDLTSQDVIDSSIVSPRNPSLYHDELRDTSIVL